MFFSKIKTFFLLFSNAYRGSKFGRGLVEDGRRKYLDITKQLRFIRENCLLHSKAPDCSPVFVLSAGWRSGSTLLQRMLISRNKLLIWGEPFHRSNVVAHLMDQLRPFSEDWPPESYYAGPFTDNITSKWIANYWPDLSTLIEAQYAFLDTLYGSPARKRGFADWGIKEVRWGIDHASYLRWLYPNSKIIFVYRNPYDAYCSFREFPCFGWLRWPENPIITALGFARMWKSLVLPFTRQYSDVDALVLRYEDLGKAETHELLETYLGRPITPYGQLKYVRKPNETATSQGIKGLRYIPKTEFWILKRELKRVAEQFGYYGLTK